MENRVRVNEYQNIYVRAYTYENRRVAADPETLRALSDFSEREINKETGLSRRIIRRIRHQGPVKFSTMQRITDFLTRKLEADLHSTAESSPSAGHLLVDGLR